MIEIPCFVVAIADVSRRQDRRESDLVPKEVVLFQAEIMLKTIGPPATQTSFYELLDVAIGRRCRLIVED
jgi:hypothetical protein